jgi:ribosomal protein L37E
MNDNNLVIPGDRRHSDEKFCFSCGNLLHASAPACVRCGAAQPAAVGQLQASYGRPGQLQQNPLPPNHVYCRGCGNPIHFQAVACPNCGAPQSAFGTAGIGPDRDVAGFLAIFLGGIGAHKFYLGKGIQGVLYLLFCWTFIPAIVALIEGIIYFCMSKPDFVAKYRH